ncbi:MAG TPA: helix-turn-helix transcriptional regulator [Firmicutes bacterium]|nr:helix-turn-helix transcriptional regulator [Bacillota bacterium]
MVRLNALKLARMKAGLRQIDLAVALGVSESLITKWETGRAKPGGRFLERLAQLLGTEPRRLLEEVERDE